MRRAAGAVAAAAFALLVAGAACFRPPRPGDPCSDAELSCFDAATALECLGGVRVGVHCGGPRGCEAGAASLWCDQSDANENDLCVAPRMKKFGDGACSLDKKSMLACVNGRFVERARCRGPLGCGHVGQHVSCDASVAEPGDGCLGEGNAACSVDGARALRCAGGRFAVAAACDGEDRCRIEENHVRCDERRGRPGAPCRATSACSVDGASLLACTDGAWKERVRCRGPKQCSIDGDRIACDTSIAAKGEGCDGAGASCTADGKAMLHCVDDRWDIERPCPRGCEVDRERRLVSCK